MGVFDLPGLAFSWVDGSVDDLLPAPLRIGLWAMLAGAACMVLYATISNQAELAALKARASDARRALSRYDGDFEGALAIARDNLKISFRRLRLSLVPALTASVPLVLVAVWMDNTFAYERPDSGELVVVTAVWPDAAGSGAENKEQHWQVAWPNPGDIVTVKGARGEQVMQFPADGAGDTIHHWQWWNLLLGNPAGYLPDSSPLREVTLSLSPARYLDGVPGWMASWEFLFLLVAAVTSLATKMMLRLE